MQWDRRRKKYVQVTQGHEKQNKFVKNEAGQLIKHKSAPQGKVYSEWVSKSKKVVPKVGEEEDKSSLSNYEQVKKSTFLKYKLVPSSTNDGSAEDNTSESSSKKRLGRSKRPVKNELKSPDQIIKMKKEKMKKMSLEQGKKRKRNPPNVPRKKQRTGINFLNY